MKRSLFARRLLAGTVLAGFAGAGVVGLHFMTAPAAAQSVAAGALTGKVSSSQEGMMEGVIVSAKAPGSTITTSVVTNAQGVYSFPADRLAPGKYNITIRAAGYMLSATSVTVSAQPATQDLALSKVTAGQMENQLTDTEWLMSVPGTDAQKAALNGCDSCHTLQRPLFSTFTADELIPIVFRMASHPPNSSPEHPWFYDDANVNLARAPSDAQVALAKFIATINLSTMETHNFPLKTMPRPKGDDTKVIYTTYDLPRPDAHVHDEELDAQGNVWYSSFDSQYIGKLDPKTGKAVEYKIPIARPNSPQGGLQIEVDPQGRVYFGNMEQDQIARFDPKTEKMETFLVPLPDEGLGETHLTMIDPMHIALDGNLWINFASAGSAMGTWRVNLDTNKWTKMSFPANSPGGQPYDLASDSQNNMIGHSTGQNTFWITDAKTLATTWYPLPEGTLGCRRGHMILDQDIEWCADYNGDGVVSINAKTHEAKAYKTPIKFTQPYDALGDGKGYAFAGGMTSDLVVRLNSITGKWNNYSLPVQNTNIRHIALGETGANGMSTVWVADQHGNTITHVEPLSN